MGDDSHMDRPGEGDKTDERILDKAEEMVIGDGLQAMRMDDLAGTLGMSKKTLYIHFPGKNEIIKAIIRRIAGRISASLKAVLEDERLSFPQKLDKVHCTLAARLSVIRPSLLRELERTAPEAYAYLDEMRSRNIPVVFGTLLREGMREGYVREEIDPQFAAEAWMHMMRGLMQPAVIDHLGLSLRETLDLALLTFFRGVLSEKGQVEFDRLGAEKHLYGKRRGHHHS